MIKGGIAILDEGNRMSEKSWASLAPLLDNRRYVESIVAGIKIKAHPNFRLVATMNDDASTFELPEYITRAFSRRSLSTFPSATRSFTSLRKIYPSPKTASCTTSPTSCNWRTPRMSATPSGRHQRGALRHQTEESRHTAHHETEALEISIVQVWARKPSAMPEETNPALPDPGSLTRGRFTYFPVVPGRVEFAAELRTRFCATVRR
jgi:hypothetical protein